MTIGEVARHSGLAASAIRYYEKAGLLGAPVRISGRRVYEATTLHELTVIRFAKDTGFTLPEVKALLRGFPATTQASARWRKMAREKMKELESTLLKVRAMQEMLEAVMSCRCRNLVQCAQDFASRTEKPLRVGKSL
jgi:DNA-binding transcriptional MerR regulator